MLITHFYKIYALLLVYVVFVEGSLVSVGSVINIQNGLKFLSIVSILPQVSKILNTFVSFISKSRF